MGLVRFTRRAVDWRLRLGVWERVWDSVRHVALGPHDTAMVDGFTTTTVARTLIDLASVVEEEQLEVALEHALRRGLVTVDSLRCACERAATRRGRAVLRDLLDERDPSYRPTESAFETRLRRVLKQYGLPMPRNQVRVVVEGGRVRRLDLAWPALRVCIEADGDWHRSKEQLAADHARRNEIVRAGWRPLVVTWRHLVTEPAAIADEIRGTLEQAIREQSAAREVCTATPRGQ